MTPLPAEFTKQGWSFHQLKRHGNVALFRKDKPKASGPGLIETWEVVIVQQYGEREIAGVKIPAAEAMPPSESWGTKGWSCTNYKDADALWSAKCAEEGKK